MPRKRPRGAAPRGARLPGGGPAFFIRKQGERIAGLRPAPGFLKPLAGARFIFWVGKRSRAVAGLFRGPPTGPDLETFFLEIFFRLDFCAPRPKPSPRGEGGPAQPGRMRGRPGTQRSRRKPAYRRQAVGHGLSTRKGWVQNRPLIRLLRRQLPPKGKPQSVAGQPPISRLYKTPPPARPAGGRAPSHGGCRAAGQ